jgi:UDP-glucose 4-epimerase
MTGMGGELASLTASLLEREPGARRLAGFDLDPPRRRLRTPIFELIDPLDQARICEFVAQFDPHVVVHLGVYEPGARAGDQDAERWSAAVIDAVVTGVGRSLEHLVIRSGVTVYGQAAREGARPNEDVEPAPNTHFGRILSRVETQARLLGVARRIPVGVVRLAPVLGPHVPSPLGRLLRLPAVPVPMWSRAQFSVISDHDAAAALVAAVTRGVDGPVNVAAPGSITALGALRRGRRLPIPLVGPQWYVARPIARLAGAPVPEHVVELLQHGRLVDTDRLVERLGNRLAPDALTSTPGVIEELYSWPAILRHVPSEAA